LKIGVDMGGSHIAVGLVDNGKIVEKKAFMYLNRTNDDSLKKEIENAIEYVNKFKKDEITESIGVSLPGNCENGVLLDAVNIRNFNMAGCHVVEELQNRLNIPVYIENDTLCALIGEKYYRMFKRIF